MIDKRLLIIDSILILAVLVSLFLLIGYRQPLAIAPLEEQPLFTMPKIDYLLIDKNINFDSPKSLFLNEQIEIEPGKYFLKISYDGQDEIREIEAQLKIKLELRSLSDGSVGLFNAGNNNLEVETYEIGNLVDSSLVIGGRE